MQTDESSKRLELVTLSFRVPLELMELLKQRAEKDRDLGLAAAARKALRRGLADEVQS